jgi:hypothetical protein
MTLSGGCVMFAFPPKADITEHDHCAKSYQRHSSPMIMERNSVFRSEACRDNADDGAAPRAAA